MRASSRSGRSEPISAKRLSVSEMIQEEAQRSLELDEKIKALKAKIKEIAKDSKIAKTLLSIPGFGTICTAELAGEIGTIERFSKEGSLALYIGMSTLDNSSGKYQGSKQPKHVNTRAKAAMMVALDRHRKYVPESQRYYEKKRSEGKKYNQAIRLWDATSAESFTSYSKKNGSTRYAPKRGIPRARSVRDR
jgi:transposase